jgi:molecular chaperone GrpE
MTARKKKERKARMKGTTSGSDTPVQAPADSAGPGSLKDTETDEEVRDSLAPSNEEVIEALSTELSELEDRHLRVVAEFDNFRKRTARERAQQSERAQAGLVKDLLESLDDLARVSELGSHDHDAAGILEGVQLVEVKLKRALEQAGLTPIEAVGQRFDPELHDAMVTETTNRPEEDHIVSQELAKGYRFRGNLLRPSLVAVKMYRPDSEGGEG